MLDVGDGGIIVTQGNVRLANRQARKGLQWKAEWVRDNVAAMRERKWQKKEKVERCGRDGARSTAPSSWKEMIMKE